MPIRTITIDGARWDVMSSGRVTQYDRDEFALLFVSGDGAERRVRTVRYSPQGARSRDRSLAELSDADLARLFAHSQESATSPEAGYRR
ncbi:MAG TPA: hypothetical protein VLD17_07435 [Gemmatimonadaceae bacterium]|nr:hypothetical protein [Gemmatimonadaceae bacterium]